MPAKRLTLTLWNVHRGLWNDGRTDPAAMMDVMLAEVTSQGTDILVLVEADAEAYPHRGLFDLARLSSETGLIHAHPEHRWGPESGGFHGVTVLVGPKLAAGVVHLLDLPGQCHRGAVVVDLTLAEHPIRLVATHLSLGQPARVAQMRIIGQHLARREARPAIVAGDLNEWRPWGGIAFSRRVTITPFAGPVRRSFPAGRPLLPLDRVLTGPGARVEKLEVLDGRGIRAASDHRPVRAQVTLD